jgi:site-specific DNA-cytosine methylase
MNIIEFFAGSRSIGKVAEKMGHTVFSTDNKKFRRIDLVIDILDFDYKSVPFMPDVLWFSPPCTGFSIAGISNHFAVRKGKHVAISQTSKLGIKLLEKTIEIIDYYLKINPKLIFFIENPRCVMRKMPQLARFKRRTVTYCQYGDKRMKPTDIWTNCERFKPKMCKNGAPCHVAAPRGSRTGTQGLKGAYDRSKIPKLLCEDIIKSCL